MHLPTFSPLPPQYPISPHKLQTEKFLQITFQTWIFQKFLCYHEKDALDYFFTILTYIISNLKLFDKLVTFLTCMIYDSIIL